MKEIRRQIQDYFAKTSFAPKHLKRNLQRSVEKHVTAPLKRKVHASENQKKLETSMKAREFVIEQFVIDGNMQRIHDYMANENRHPHVHFMDKDIPAIQGIRQKAMEEQVKYFEVVRNKYIKSNGGLSAQSLIRAFNHRSDMLQNVVVGDVVREGEFKILQSDIDSWDKAIQQKSTETPQERPTQGGRPGWVSASLRSGKKEEVTDNKIEMEMAYSPSDFKSTVNFLRSVPNSTFLDNAKQKEFVLETKGCSIGITKEKGRLNIVAFYHEGQNKTETENNRQELSNLLVQITGLAKASDIKMISGELTKPQSSSLAADRSEARPR